MQQFSEVTPTIILDIISDKRSPVHMKCLNGMLGLFKQADHDKVYLTLWRLSQQGLIYPNMYKDTPKAWSWRLTDLGASFCLDDDNAPDPLDWEGWFEHFRAKVPASNELVQQYTLEAVKSYYSQNFLACSVMLGVASESAALALMHAVSTSRSEDSPELAAKRNRLNSKIEKPESSISEKTALLLEIIDADKRTLKNNKLYDGIIVQILGIQTLIRKHRNEAGHPNSMNVTLADCKTMMVVFTDYMKAVHSLIGFYQAPAE